MPTTRLREETEYRFPDDITYQCRLVDVTTKEITYFKKDAHGVKTNEQDSFTKWQWTFDITSGPYLGGSLYGDTESEMTTRGDNTLRQWAEALLGREIEVGEDFDTDDIIGLPCVVTIRHDPPRPRRDGNGMFYPCVVDDVMPKGTADNQPPF